MSTTRRGFLATAGAAATQDVAQAQDHGHEHQHQAVPSDPALRVKALESLLIEKGLVDRAALDALVDTYEHKIGPRNGAKVVARAWADPAYKQRLLANASTALAEFGYTGMQGEDMLLWRTHPRCTTWWSVRYAPAIRGQCLACRRCGTNPLRTGRAR